MARGVKNEGLVTDLYDRGEDRSALFGVEQALGWVELRASSIQSPKKRTPETGLSDLQCCLCFQARLRF